MDYDPSKEVGFFFFWLTACGILAPQPGMDLVPCAVEAQRPKAHWTTRKLPGFYFIFYFLDFIFKNYHIAALTLFSFCIQFSEFVGVILIHGYRVGAQWRFAEVMTGQSWRRRVG